MREGLIRSTFVALAALSLLLTLTTAFALVSRAPSVDAADSETTALIGYFNQYRTSHGAGALSPSINAYAQSQAQKSIDSCGYVYTPGLYDVIWASYGYTSAQSLWNVYQSDSQVMGYIGNPNYHSVGVGRSYGCNWGWLWVIVLDKAGGGSGTTTPTPSPSPSRTPTATPGSSLPPTPTPTATPIPSPTPTLPCAGTADVNVQCTFTPTAVPTDSPTPTASPVATPSADLPGDADCNHTVDGQDGMIVLWWAAGFTPISPCLNQNDGVNCLDGIDVTDVLAIIAYLGEIPFELPVGCPPLGTIVTSSPSPVPTPTATPVITETPVPTATSAAGDAIHHCQLALVSYQLDTDLLDGDSGCTSSAGTSYNCNFGNGTASCAASSIAYPDYICSFAGSGFADCVPNAGEPEYQCFRNTPGAVECLPTYVGFPTYVCGVSGGPVTCTSDPPFPDFVCTKQTVDFDCVAQSQQ